MAPVKFGTSVNSLVLSQVPRATESIITPVTAIRFIASVSLFVVTEGPRSTE